MTTPISIAQTGIRPAGSLRLFAPFAAGILFAAVLCLGVGIDGPTKKLLLGALGAAALAPVVAWIPGLLQSSLLFALAATLSISIKKHLVFVKGHLGGAIGLRISITEVLMCALLVAAVAGLASIRRRIRVDRTIATAFAAYFVFATLSVLGATDVQLAFYEWTALIQAFLVFIFLENWLDRPARLRVFAAGLLAGLIIQSAVTIIQQKKPGMLQLAFLGAADDQEDRIINGRVALPDVDTGTTFVEGEVTHRPTGLLIHPNVLALYLVLSIPVAAAAWLYLGGWHFQLLSLCALALGLIAIYMSLSRSGWAGLAGALALGGYFLRRRGKLRISGLKRVLMAGAMAGLLVFLGLRADRIYSRWKDTAGEALDFRRDLTVIAWNMIAQHPLMGVGLNSFVSVSNRYDEAGMTRLKAFPVHNIFLLETSETGLPGGIAFIALAGLMFARCLRAARSCRTSASHALAVLTTTGIFGFWIGELSNFVYRVPIITSLIWAHCAFILAIGRICGPPEAPKEES